MSDRIETPAHDTRPEPEQRRGRVLAELLRSYPIITLVLVGATLAGAVLGIWVLPEDWTLWRRIAGGALGGAGSALICTAPRIIG